MDPASSNPPIEPVAVPQPQEAPVAPPIEPVTPTTPPPPPTVPASETPPVPEQPAKSKALVIVAVAILLIAALAVSAYFLGFLSFGRGDLTQNRTEPVGPTAIPLENPVSSESAVPIASPSAGVQGIVSGKLCYPSEIAPAGDIVAKNLISDQVSTQKFIGTEEGGTPAYTFSLSPGTYHLKYQTAPAMAGYYTACAKDPTSTVCAQDNNHVNLDVEVTAGKTTTGIDLCDFYWNQTQKAALDASF